MSPAATDTAAEITLRPLAAGDVQAVVAIDAASEGRTRHDYFERRLAAARRELGKHAVRLGDGRLRLAARARQQRAHFQVLLHAQRGEHLAPLGHLADAEVADLVRFEVRRLAALQPTTLATMHGPSFQGDGAAQLTALAASYATLVSADESNA